MIYLKQLRSGNYKIRNRIDFDICLKNEEDIKDFSKIEKEYSKHIGVCKNL